MALKIPKSYQLGSHTIKVIKDPEIEEAGTFNYSRLEERINSNIDESVQFEAHWHEVIEGANILGECKLPHRTIQILGDYIAQVLKTSKY